MSESASNSTGPAQSDEDLPVNVPGLVSISIFYLIILAIGIWAGWKQKREARAAGRDLGNQEDVMLAGRNVGLFVGVLTMGGTDYVYILRSKPSCLHRRNFFEFRVISSVEINELKRRESSFSRERTLIIRLHLTLPSLPSSPLNHSSAFFLQRRGSAAAF